MKIGKTILQVILAPFSLLYWLISGFHHLSYTKGWKRSIQFDLPVINIGNLNTGGTGKTPHVSYIAQYLSKFTSVAILSRGYGRRSRGYIEVGLNHSSEEVGDEPLLLKHKNPDLPVVVCEERVLGVPQILHHHPEVETIILDDAFQHRRIHPSHQILLTCYGDLYIHDFPLPSGRLREPKIGANRADAIIITKVPHALNEQEIQDLRKELKLQDEQALFYSQMQYGAIYSFQNTDSILDLNTTQSLHLICGIASPEYIISYLEHKHINLTYTLLKDHAPFTDQFLKQWEKQCQDDLSLKIVMTEKDAMRLKAKIDTYPHLHKAIWILPITLKIGPDEKAFQSLLKSWL